MEEIKEVCNLVVGCDNIRELRQKLLEVPDEKLRKFLRSWGINWSGKTPKSKQKAIEKFVEKFESFMGSFTG